MYKLQTNKHMNKEHSERKLNEVDGARSDRRAVLPAPGRAVRQEDICVCVYIYIYTHMFVYIYI